MKKRVSLILKIAATYIGTVVGAGFASGQSIMQFFTAYGAFGGISIAVTTFLFIWLGTKMMILSRRIQAFSYQEFNNFLFGNLFGKVANALTFLILFGVTAVMLSGTGSLFEEQLGLPYQIGIVVSVALSYLVMSKELNGILAVNSLVVPMMLVFIVLIAFRAIEMDGIWGVTGSHTQLRDNLKWMLSPFMYAALNLAFAQAVMVPLGREVEDESEIKWGGFLGGVGLGMMLLISHFALNSRMPEILQFQLPMAEIIRSLGPFVHVLFLLVIYGEIFTTLIGNVFGVTRQIQSLYKLPKSAIVLAVLLACFIISQAGFTSLLTYLYPLFGYLGIILLIVLAAKRLPEK
ncbi:membrane protein [Paenibacillus dendritiformis]|uniref:YkvI family membrane protein n=1 Tax=Paenibacillus dendritiformis TaxID=130049 RepID=UPI001B2DB68B|nr:membrane protein [Paenibacillus dendritiformis]